MMKLGTQLEREANPVNCDCCGRDDGGKIKNFGKMVCPSCQKRRSVIKNNLALVCNDLTEFFSPELLADYLAIPDNTPDCADTIKALKAEIERLQREAAGTESENVQAMRAKLLAAENGIREMEGQSETAQRLLVESRDNYAALDQKLQIKTVECKEVRAENERLKGAAGTAALDLAIGVITGDVTGVTVDTVLSLRSIV
jgi:hypothetical protein